VTCDDGRRGFSPAIPDLGGRHAVEPGLAASERHHRQQVVGRDRPGVFAGNGKGGRADGKSERAEQGALPGAGWRVVLLLGVIA
jgi:hypothetical protein